MKESKFRGKRVDTGGWVYGDLLANNGSPIIVAQVKRDYILKIHTNGGDHWAIQTPAYRVIPETVGQLSKDGAGNEVYEGDCAVIESQILIPMEAFKGVVTFTESCFYVDNGTEMHPVWSDAYCLRVIGNIHDNPELLKDGTT